MEQHNVVQDGIIMSPVDNSWSPAIPKGSFYLTVVSALRGHLRQFGDWPLYTNCITEEVFMASQFEPIAKRF